MDNKDKANKYYYLSLPSDITTSFKVSSEIKKECDVISSKLGISTSSFIKNAIIDSIVDFYKKK